MKKCAYCRNEMGQGKYKRTGEHVIPKSLIDLYPEQDISFDYKNYFVDNKGVTVADVCSVCNGGILSQLDSYGKKLIEGKFYYPYEYDAYNQVFQIELDTPLFTRWIMKIIYNEMRRSKWPVDKITKYISYIMTGMGDLTRIDFFMGLHVNLNPVPEEVFGIMPLQINMEPHFFKEDFRKGVDKVKFEIKGKEQSCAIRFGNCVVYTVLWADDTDESTIKEMSDIIESEFRFRKLKVEENIYSVRCVSSPTNVMLANYSHFMSESAVRKMLLEIQDTLHGRTIPEARKQFEEMWDDDMSKKGRALVEASMFPKNKKKLLVMETYYEKE